MPSTENLLRHLLACCGIAASVHCLLVSGAPVLDYWHTDHEHLVDASGKNVRIAGINWYGFEGTSQVVHGLWAQDYRAILDTVRSEGFNVIRIPISNEMVEAPVHPANVAFRRGKDPINSDLVGLTSLQILDRIVAYAGQIGLRIILDNHRSSARNGGTETGLWYTAAFPESAWIQDWKILTARYRGNAAVIGVDLRNEPHDAKSGGACWGCGDPIRDWQLAAERAGNAIQSVNPELLVFVEGTDCYGDSCSWWGGNLEGARAHPVVLNIPQHVVYSAHEYGPSLSPQPWFNPDTSEDSLDKSFTKHWGYLAVEGIAPVWVGEFGTANGESDLQDQVPGSQGQWFHSLIGFLQKNPAIGWTYWALNSEDRYGLLDADYRPKALNPEKVTLLQRIRYEDVE